MSTTLVTVKGRPAPLGAVDQAHELMVNRFAGGADGPCSQLTLLGGTYVQLDVLGIEGVIRAWCHGFGLYLPDLLIVDDPKADLKAKVAELEGRLARVREALRAAGVPEGVVELIENPE